MARKRLNTRNFNLGADEVLQGALVQGGNTPPPPPPNRGVSRPETPPEQGVNLGQAMQQAQEVVKSGGSFQMDLGDFRLSDRGLLIANDATRQSVDEFGAMLGQIASSMSWWVGDWGLYYKGGHGKKYRIAAEISELSEDTVRKYCETCERFPISERVYDLFFTHYYVAKSWSNAHHYLQIAERNGWSVSTMRKYKNGKIDEEGNAITERPTPLRIMRSKLETVESDLIRNIKKIAKTKTGVQEIRNFIHRLESILDEYD